MGATPANISCANNRLLIMSGLFFVAFLFSCFGLISTSIDIWLTRTGYSHGFLVPIIVLYFIWEDREKLAKLEIRPSIFAGLVLTLCGFFVLIAGTIGSLTTLVASSILIIIPGLILTVLGKNYLKAMAIPVGYLVFMTPLLDFVTEVIHWPFQLLTATASSTILNTINIPVFRTIQFLELPNITLEVARECSGANYLVSMLAIAIPLAHFTLRTWWKKIVLVCFGAIVGPLVNILRVTIIGIWTYNGGEVHGPFHVFQALFVGVLGFFLLITIAWLLGDNQASDKGKLQTKDFYNLSAKFQNAKRFNAAWGLSVAVMLAVGLYLHTYNAEAVQLKGSLNDLPYAIGEWRAGPESNAKIIKPNGADNELIRNYRKASGEKIVLSISYFESQSQGRELVHFSTMRLFNKSQGVKINAGAAGYVQAASKLVATDGQRTAYLFWLDLNGRTVSNKYNAKMLTMLDGIIHQRTNGTFIIIAADVDDYKNETEAMGIEQEFAKELIPMLDSLIP